MSLKNLQIKSIGIIGLGLIGGSLAKAFKKKFGFNIAAMNRSEEPLKNAFNDGVVSLYSTSDLSIFSDCDIIFICTPVDKIIKFVDSLKPYLKESCIITDVGSTKKSIYDEMLSKKDINFIGGHPMAGSEQTGYSASKEYLFENAYYIVTPTPYVKNEMIEFFIQILKEIGAIPIIIPADIHDYIVAAISHVPHIIAASIVNMVKKLDNSENYMHTLAAGGFKDITRIASSSPEMWSGICHENSECILKVIDEYIQFLDGFKNNIENYNNVFSFFNEARDYRNSFSDNKNSAVSRLYEVLIDVEDRPGIFATVSTMLSVNNINIKNIGILNSREYSDGILQILLESEADKEKSILLLKKMNFKVYIK